MRILGRTNTRPFELFFGRPFNEFTDFKDINGCLDTNVAIEQRLTKLTELRDTIWPAIAKRTTEERKKRATRFNNGAKIQTPLAPGTKVMAVDKTRESKWDPVFEGPFTIERQTAGGSYELTDLDGQPIERRRTIDQLKPLDDGTPSGRRRSNSNSSITTRTDEPSVTNEQQTSDNNEGKSFEDHYEVAGILRHRLSRRKAKGYEYLVRWKGYGDDDNSWVHESDFGDHAVIKRYWKQHRLGSVTLPRGAHRPRRVRKLRNT